MRFVSRSSNVRKHLANTQVFNLLDNQLTLVLRSWGSSDYNQKFIDEVSHYLSSTQADLEVTTPFDYQENLSPLANRTRMAILLAHDSFYKNENKSEYLVGFEAAVLLHSKGELAWSSVGRFSFDKQVGKAFNRLSQSGTDLDRETLLPVQLIGVEKEIDIASGSMAFGEKDRLIVASLFNTQLKLTAAGAADAVADAIPFAAENAHWFSVITL